MSRSLVDGEALGVFLPDFLSLMGQFDLESMTAMTSAIWRGVWHMHDFHL